MSRNEKKTNPHHKHTLKMKAPKRTHRKKEKRYAATVRLRPSRLLDLLLDLLASDSRFVAAFRASSSSFSFSFLSTAAHLCCDIKAAFVPLSLYFAEGGNLEPKHTHTQKRATQQNVRLHGHPSELGVPPDLRYRYYFVENLPPQRTHLKQTKTSHATTVLPRALRHPLRVILLDLRVLRRPNRLVGLALVLREIGSLFPRLLLILLGRRAPVFLRAAYVPVSLRL